MNWLRNWLQNWQLRREEAALLKRYGCVCYCRGCRGILDNAIPLHNGSEYSYSCSGCNAESVFNFDIAPVPILVRFNGETVFPEPAATP